MAMADYKLCDNCGRKAFYDANISDPGYIASWDEDSGYPPIGIAVLCTNCNQTHQAVIVPRTPAPSSDGGE